MAPKHKIRTQVPHGSGSELALLGSILYSLFTLLTSWILFPKRK